MFFERFNYAMTHLGWLGYLTAVYFAGIGVWFGRLLWRRDTHSVWQQRCEIFEEYRTLNERAIENQQELLEAFEVHESSLLQKDAQLQSARKQRDEAIAENDRIALQRQADELKLSHRDTEIQLLKAQLDSAQHELDAQQLTMEKQLAQHDSRNQNLLQRIEKLDQSLQQANQQTKETREQKAVSDQSVAELRNKYAELMQQFTRVKDGQATFALKDKQREQLQNDLVELQDELSAAKTNLHQRDTQIAELSSELESLRGDLETRSMAFDDLRALQESTVAELHAARDLSNELQEQQAQTLNMRKEFVALEKELEQVLLNEHNAKVQLAQANARLDGVQDLIQQHRETDLKTISELRGQLDEAEARLSEIVERPADADDLTEIVGLSRCIEEQLNEAGVFRFEQIANWTPKEERIVEKQLVLPGRVRDGQWVQQAIDLAGLAQAERSGKDSPEPSRPKITSYVRALRRYGNLSVKVDESLGVLFTRRPSHIDDLTQIRGVGKVNERCLRKVGVYQFQQIADWNEYNVWAFNQLMSFKGRIEREDWVGQARDLIAHLEQARGDAPLTLHSDAAASEKPAKDHAGEAEVATGHTRSHTNTRRAA